MSKKCQKLEKKFKKIAKNFLFFSKQMIGNFFEKKNSSFWPFFDIQMAIFRSVRSTVSKSTSHNFTRIVK